MRDVVRTAIACMLVLLVASGCCPYAAAQSPTPVAPTAQTASPPASVGTPPTAPVTPPPAIAPSAPTSQQAAPKDDDKGDFWDGGGAVLLGAVPTLIWALFAMWALAFLFPQVVQLLGRLKMFKGLGVELEFALAERLDDAADARNIVLDPRRKKVLLARVTREKAIVAGAAILWVDDHPTNNRNEAAFLKKLGATVEFAVTTDEALARIARGNDYDVVISDMARPPDNSAGLALRDRLQASGAAAPIILYVGTPQTNQPRPSGIFGITSWPDELIHLVFDAMERSL